MSELREPDLGALFNRRAEWDDLDPDTARRDGATWAQLFREDAEDLSNEVQRLRRELEEVEFQLHEH